MCDFDDDFNDVEDDCFMDEDECEDECDCEPLEDEEHDEPDESESQDDGFTGEDAFILGGAMGWAYEEGFRDGRRRRMIKSRTNCLINRRY